MENMHESFIKAMGKRWFILVLVEVSKTNISMVF